jgi:hypothetical protein
MIALTNGVAAAGVDNTLGRGVETLRTKQIIVVLVMCGVLSLLNTLFTASDM